MRLGTAPFAIAFGSVLRAIAAAVLLPLAFCANSTLAQELKPVADGTLGAESSVVTPTSVQADRIDGGAIRGANLFHSFSQFNIGEGREAYFANPNGISNILSRVTGSDASKIFGKLGVLGNANLFLINPNGIIFGKNASLDVRGSFVGSTASSLKFADGVEFSAKATQSTPLLTISVPIGLQFGANPGSIQVQGDGKGSRGTRTTELIDTTNALRVPSNQTLALVGGDVSLQGATLKTEGGRIELGSVAGDGFVSLIPINKGFALGYDGVQNFGNIQLSQKATVDASGVGGGDIQLQGRDVTLTDNSVIFGYTLGNENGGDVFIRAQDLIVRDGSLVVVSSSGSGKAGNLNVSASNSVEISGGENNQLPSGLQFPSGLYTQSYGDGTSGNLTIDTGKLIVSNGAQVSSSSFGKEPAGNLKVSASEFVKLVGTANDFASSLSTESYGDGTSGNLTIDTGKLIISDGGQVTTSARGEGLGGNLTVRASESIELTGSSKTDLYFVSGLFSQTSNNGAALDLTIDTGKLTLRDGARISTSSSVELTRVLLTVYRSGKLVTATSISVLPKTVVVNTGTINFSTNTRNFSHIGYIIRNAPRSGRRASRISDFRKESKLFSTNESFSSIQIVNIDSNNSSKAGNLVVTASDFVELVGTTPDGRFPSGLFTDTSSKGSAGNLTINTNKLIISNGAEATVSSTGQGAAGNLDVTANSVSLDNGKITSQTSFGNGGNVKLNIADLLLMRRNSEISTTAGTEKQGGDGGNITINAPNGFIVAVPNENSDITANAFTGKGGNVQINASGIYGTQFREKENQQTSDITASSEFGVNGIVEINTPDIDLNSALINLPSVPVDTELAQGCNSPNYAQSSFIITGRGGLPPNPKDILTPDAIEVGWVTLNPEIEKNSRKNITIPETTTPEPIVEATGWVFGPKGEVIFTAQVPTQHHNSWQTPPKCHVN
ncbi:MAG: S-layer family protein [Iphinoe sp. HA4291-MV1]|nr:S-layer family protein [Iphinoe sp. HA4291-MV1]